MVRKKKPKKKKKSTLKSTGLKRASVLDQTKKNTLVRRGFFVGSAVVDADRKHFEPDELVRIFNRLKKDEPTNGELGYRFWYPYFFIQYYFGCRLSEVALILDEDDISLEKKQIVIKRLKKTREEQGFKQQVYAIDDRLVNVIKMVRKWKKDEKLEANPFLFPSRRSAKRVGAERLSQLRDLEGYQAVSRFTAHRKFKSIAAACSVPEHLQHNHVLRHTRATLMLASGARPEAVQFLLGHSNIQMTYRYMGIANAMRAQLNKQVLAAGLGI